MSSAEQSPDGMRKPNSSSLTEESSVQESTPAKRASSFSELLHHPAVLARLSQLGFATPTDVQAAAIPQASNGVDLVVQAKTGSGKTFAFCLPLVQMLHGLEEKARKDSASPTKDGTLALLIAPTRELALQIQQVFTSLTDLCAPVLIIGGADEQKQREALSRDPRVVVGTPGRLLDLIKRRVLDLRSCRYFVLDEADEMLSMGFIEDVRAILSRLPAKRQGLFVSATVTPRVEMLAHSFLAKAEYILVNDYTTDVPAIEHLYYEVGSDLMAKPLALCDIIETQRPRSAIIFCNTKSDTQLVEVLLRRRGFDARRLNSDLSQSQRERVLRRIRQGELQILVATDIAARGLDIEQIDLVINYAIHEQAETYIHRTGRTGRAGRRGRAVSLVSARDFGSFHFLTKVLDLEFKKSTLPTDEEVASARAAHLYEMLRRNEPKLDPRATLLARKILLDAGIALADSTPIDLTTGADPAIEASPENTDELLTIIAKLSAFTIEHFVNQEASSLDEELDAQPQSEPTRQPPPREPRQRSERKDRERQEPRDKNREGRSEKRHSTEEPFSAASTEQYSTEKDSHRPIPREHEEQRLRLYLGQGTVHGMNKEVFAELAERLANVESNKLKRLVFRSHYGFVDVSRRDADALLQNLAGIECGGRTLPIEIATTLDSPRRDDPDGRGTRRPHGESRHRQNRDRRHGSRDNSQRRDRGHGRDQRRGHSRAPRNDSF